jgi:hypothetical protein
MCLPPTVPTRFPRKPWHLSPSPGTWQYALGFLPAGDYTLAFSCDAADDDPVDYDSITVPLPDNQAYELSLDEGGQEVCDLGLEGSC